MTTEKQLTEITVKPSELEIKIMDAIAMLEKIPEELWCTCKTHNSLGQSCFQGHMDNNKQTSNPIENAFYSSFSQPLYRVNDGLRSLLSKVPNEILSLPTPKQRTLAGLKLLLKKEMELNTLT